jgi:hypothetical protein
VAGSPLDIAFLILFKFTVALASTLTHATLCAMATAISASYSCS